MPPTLEKYFFKFFLFIFFEFFRFGHFRSREGSGWTGFVKMVTNHCLTACGDHSRSVSCNICPFLAVRGSTAHPPGRQVRVLNHWAAARRSRPLSGARPRPGPGAGPAPARPPRPAPAGARAGSGPGQLSGDRRDRRAAARWLSTRTCLPGGWAVEPRTAQVEPRTAKNGQMLHETDREWSPRAVKQ